MKKQLFILSAILVMLVVSRFAVRIVDATVQIDGAFGVLLLFLPLLNAGLVLLSRLLYRKLFKDAGGKQTQKPAESGEKEDAP